MGRNVMRRGLIEVQEVFHLAREALPYSLPPTLVREVPAAARSCCWAIVRPLVSSLGLSLLLGWEEPPMPARLGERHTG